MSNIHEFMDRFPMVVSSVFPKYFREGTASPTIWEHLDGTQLTIPDVTTAGDHLVIADSMVGKLHGLVRVYPHHDTAAPLIIYHHGAKEFDTSFKGIFGKQPQLHAHLVLVRAPFHENFRTFLYGIGSLSRYLAMYAVSVGVIEAVTQQFRAAGCGSVCVTGTSLGGFISLVHHIRFDSADAYAPMLAGPNLAHCLLESAYARQTDKGAKAQHEYMENHLNFTTAYQKVKTENVYPLLGRYDQIVAPSINIPAYGTDNIKFIDRGHFTGSTAFKLLADHITSIALSQPKEPPITVA